MANVIQINQDVTPVSTSGTSITTLKTWAITLGSDGLADAHSGVLTLNNGGSATVFDVYLYVDNVLLGQVQTQSNLDDGFADFDINIIRISATVGAIVLKLYASTSATLSSVNFFTTTQTLDFGSGFDVELKGKSTHASSTATCIYAVETTTA